jgi:type III secretion system YscD/HrpQ family protein
MILRILNPPHAGAQAEIGEEPLSIGSGGDCDLILSDPLLQPVHCKIRRAGEGIEVELTGGAAHLDGDPVEKSPFAVRPGQVLSIGSTHMAFGDPGEVWSAISIPILKTLGGSAPVADNSAPSAAESTQKSAASDSSAPAKTSTMRRFQIAVLGSAVLLLVMLMALFFYRAQEKRAMTSIARTPGNSNLFGNDYSGTNIDNQATEVVAEKIRREISGADVSIYERSGRAVLRVYVRTSKQASEVESIVNSAGSKIFSEIVSLEEIEKSAQMIASMQGFELDVTFSKDGTAYWTGYMPASSDWKALKQRFEVDLPYIKENVSQITFAKEIEEALRKLLADARITAEVALNTQPRAIVLYGTMPENLADAWSDVFAALKEKYGSIVEFTDDVGTGKAVVVEGNPFHSEITGVTLGSIPSVILLDGQRIYEGTILQDGSTLTEIGENQLILTGPQGKRKIPLNLAPKGAFE